VELANSSFSELFSFFYFEIGFDIFCKFLTLFSKNPQFLIFVTQILMNGIVCMFALKKSNIPWLSVMLYITMMFFFNAMNAMRFCMACSILLLSVDYAVKRKFIKFALLVVGASMFHFTALLFFIIYFIYPFRITVKSTLIMLGVFLVVFAAFYSIFSIIIQINPKYSSYESGGEFAQSAFANYFIMAERVAVLAFILRFIRPKVKHLNGYGRYYYWCCFIAVLFSLSAIKIMMMSRFVVMFSIMEIVMIPMVLARLPKKRRAFWTNAIIVLSIIQVVVIMSFRPEWYQVTPYHNYLFQQLFG